MGGCDAQGYTFLLNEVISAIFPLSKLRGSKGRLEALLYADGYCAAYCAVIAVIPVECPYKFGVL